MITFENFVQYIEKRAREKYGDDLVVSEVKSATRPYTGMYIPQEDAPCAVVNLEEIYNEFYLKGEDIETVMETVFNILTMSPINTKEEIFEKVNTYDKDAVFAKLSLADCDEELHCEYLGMKMTYHIDLDENYSIRITHEILKNWGISEDTLREDAIKNTENIIEPTITRLPENVCFVSSKLNIGATAMICHNLMEKLKTIYDGSFFVIPSSTEEFMTVAYDEGDIDRAKIILKNGNSIFSDVMLSTNVMMYDGKLKIV